MASYDEYLDITVSPVDFYKYNSVPGATEGDTVLVPGHNGYLSSEVEISNGADTVNTVLTAAIKPYMKNYSFKSGEVSREEDFHLSEDGKTLEWYSGDAKKVVIPDGVVNIEMGWYSGEKPDEVKVIIVPDSVEELPSNFCYNFTGLEAVYLGNNIISIPASAFSRCYYLQFIHLPEELAEIGGTAFKFAMSLPEMYFPTTLESIGSNAFWTCGIRNYNLPKNLMSVAAYCICYPQATGGIWQEDSQSPEMKADLTALMKTYHFDTTPVVSTIFGENTIINAVSSFAGTDYQVTGAQVHVRAPAVAENGIFADKKHKWTHYDFTLDMSMSEIAARMQVALDHVLLLKTATEQQVETAVNDSFYSLNENTLSWVSPYTVDTDGNVTGKVLLSNGTCTAEGTLDTSVYNPPKTSSGSTLKGDKSDIKMEINIDDDEEEKSDSDEVIGTVPPFDSLEDKKETTVETEDGKAVVEIRIKKLENSSLSEKVRTRLEGYSYVPFDLSLYSEESVQLSGKLGVAVPLPKGFDGSRCSVYYVTDSNKLVDMKAKVNGDNMVFYTTALGKYVLVYDYADYTPIIIVSCCAGAVVIAAAAVIIILAVKKKKRKGKNV